MDKRWMDYFFELAAVTARMSRDPSTQVGAVIVRRDKTIASIGFNGFARGVSDDPKLYEDRETKYRRVVHAEMNALLTAREPLLGYTLFVRPLPPCPHCAGAIIQAGIKRIVWCGLEVPERWLDDMAEARQMFREARVRVIRFEPSAQSLSLDAGQFLADLSAERGREIDKLTARVIELEKRRDELQEANSNLHGRIVALRDLIR